MVYGHKFNALSKTQEFNINQNLDKCTQNLVDLD